MSLTRRDARRFWSELRPIVDDLIDWKLDRHPFMERLCAALGGDQSLYAGFVRDACDRFEMSVLSARQSPYAASAATPGAITGIPALTHRIWLTSSEGPSLPPKDYIDNVFSSYRQLPPGVTHLFWTNADGFADLLRSALARERIGNVQVRDLREFAAAPLYPKLAKLILDKKFVLAADLLKVMVLHRYGGIYADLGVVFDGDIYALVKLADYAFIVSDAPFLQSSFLACAPAAPLIEMFAAALESPEAFPPEVVLGGASVSALDELHICAGLGLTACAMLFLPMAARVLMLPAQSAHMQWRSQQSWYGDQPKHGNVLVQQAAPSFLQAESFAQLTRTFDERITIFGDLPKLRLQLRMLLGTLPQFEARPTRTCDIFHYHGSDKAQGWHNYGLFYHYLLPDYVGDGVLLEVGIGTTDPDLPSTMGRLGIPGASLRAWRELLSSREIVGADIDRNTLFQERGIATFYVDQLDARTVAEMLEAAGKSHYDIIVDDGLHTFAANLGLLRGAYGRVRSGGLYIVEDIAWQEIPAWDLYLTARGVRAAMVNIPHQTNANDNCFLLIPGGQGVSLD